MYPPFYFPFLLGGGVWLFGCWGFVCLFSCLVLVFVCSCVCEEIRKITRQKQRAYSHHFRNVAVSTVIIILPTHLFLAKAKNHDTAIHHIQMDF